MEESEVRLNREQRLALELIKRGKTIVITGQAGTGKSLLIREVIKWLHEKYGEPTRLNQSNRFYAITSTTGVSSVGIGGQTLHSWAGIGLGEGSVSGLVRLIDKRLKTGAWKNIRVLVIDEISMMSMALFEKLHDVAGRIRGRRAELWGGIQLVLCGDFLQLPPIGDGDGGRFCFESGLWRKFIRHTVYLRRIYRQTDVKFQEMLGRIRMGVVTDDDRELLLSRIVKKVPKMEIKPTKLYPFKRDVAAINQEEYIKALNRSGARERVYYPLYVMEIKKRRSLGVEIGRMGRSPRFHLSRGEIQELQNKLGRCSGREICPRLGKGPENRVVRLCVGAQVMINYNIDVEGGLANGVRGVVRQFDADDNPELAIDGHEGLVTINRASHRFETDAFKIEVMQYPLQLAWASTIHKSQSCTLSKVVTDLACVFSPGQTYVCLSRVRSLEGLYLKAIDFEKIKCDRRAKEYYHNLGYWCEYQLVDYCDEWIPNSAYPGHNSDHPLICGSCLAWYLTDRVNDLPIEINEKIVGYLNDRDDSIKEEMIDSS